MIKSLLFILLLGPAAGDSAQFNNPGDIITQAVELESNNDHDAAIELYRKISENDTSYIQIQSYLMSAYNSVKQYDSCIAIGHKVKDNYSAFRKDIYIDLGNAYLDGGNPEKALVNSIPANFNDHLKSGDRVSVYPKFKTLSSQEFQSHFNAHLPDPQFIIDANLGKLARFLRMLGFDALYDNQFQDQEIIELSNNEKRIILTRDLEILKHNAVQVGYFLRSDDPKKTDP